MKLSQAVKPISYLKAHAAEVVRDVARNHTTVVITHRGEARVIVQDVQVYEQLQESLALLKILAQSKKSARAGRLAPAGEVFARVRARAKGATRR